LRVATADPRRGSTTARRAVRRKCGPFVNRRGKADVYLSERAVILPLLGDAAPSRPPDPRPQGSRAPSSGPPSGFPRDDYGFRSGPWFGAQGGSTTCRIEFWT